MNGEDITGVSTLPSARNKQISLKLKSEAFVASASFAQPPNSNSKSKSAAQRFSISFRCKGHYAGLFHVGSARKVNKSTSREACHSKIAEAALSRARLKDLQGCSEALTEAFEMLLPYSRGMPRDH